MILPFEDPRAGTNALTRRSFLFFLMRAFSYISGGQQLVPNWHLSAMAYELEQVRLGRSTRLLVNLPPRNLKSITISIAWVAWMLGLDPTKNFVCVSYSNELSGKLARDCLSIMQSDWYREVFPGTVISTRRKAMDFETTRNGGRLATSITGTLTGRGGDIIILDDVIKPDEADSVVIRENVNEWYHSTLASRLNDKKSGAIIGVMQRLHQFDLSGMLLEAGGWNHLCLPAVAQIDECIRLLGGKFHLRRAGEALHPAHESLEALARICQEMGSERYAGQYLQNPVPADGNWIKAMWLRYYGPSFDTRDGYIIQSWDTANKTGANCAYSCCITALIRGNDIYILHVLRERLEIHDLRNRTIALAREYGARDLLIEDMASGQQLIQELRRISPSGVPVAIAERATTDKESRVRGIAAMIEAGQLHLPHEAPWLPDFKSELLGFPQTRYRDQVDALSQLLARVRSRQQEPVIQNEGPVLFY
ncbi:phage terminase large subunit [Croceicoccus sp. BE223]|uniref:phage terminase large subunit n=1 Tax=Croceicoccus sp. BE223 TaxID=2817716 RepID=UPI00285544D7|nr:phage terminase large subunit [Croceicoccus sp. BE223]MDR7102890.1 putative phage terminase large subunit-like protein [Croceicoccus sp. BE223]